MEPSSAGGKVTVRLGDFEPSSATHSATSGPERAPRQRRLATVRRVRRSVPAQADLGGFDPAFIRGRSNRRCPSLFASTLLT